MNRLTVKYLLGVWLIATLTVAPVYASECVKGNGSVLLGTNSSFKAYNEPLKAEGDTGFRCTGGSINISLLDYSWVNAKILGTSNNMKLKNIDGSGDSIPYLIYPDKEYSLAHQAGQTIDYKKLNLLKIVLGGVDIKIPVYIKTSPGANVRDGVYKDVINLEWNYDICRIAVVACILSWDGAGETNSIEVTAIVQKDCTINDAPDINFGSKAMVGQFDPVTQSINLSCTYTEGYKVWFTDGDNRQGDWRRMTDGAGNYLQYQIYQADNVTVWDSTNKVAGTGTGTNQTMAYRAKINPNQPEVPAGSYMDNVTVVVEY